MKKAIITNDLSAVLNYHQYQYWSLFKNCACIQFRFIKMKQAIYFLSWFFICLAVWMERFWPKYHWRVLSSRNVHLVHQNWYRISFTLGKSYQSSQTETKWTTPSTTICNPNPTQRHKISWSFMVGWPI
jgi:hypothetical protein